MYIVLFFFYRWISLEQLCMNLCSETLQHFYNTHVFRTAQDACAEEDLQSEIEANYFDNAAIIELISSQVINSVGISNLQAKR